MSRKFKCERCYKEKEYSERGVRTVGGTGGICIRCCKRIGIYKALQQRSRKK